MLEERPILQVRGIRKRFGDRHALKGVSLELYPQEVLGIVGGSGSGKTTLLRILHLEEEAEGEYFLNVPGLEGRNLLALDRYQVPEVRRWLAMVYQDPSRGLRMDFASLTSVVEPLILKGERLYEALVAQGLEALELADFPLERAGSPPKELSQGQRQRVQIAKALAKKPLVILLDEPTTGLDLLVQATFLDTLRTLKRRLGLSMILVSHDLSVIRMVADRIVVLYEGEVVEEGLADQVLEDPQHPFTQELVGAKL
jgi:phosphonate C-P lyase system protein PhnK